MKDKKFKKKVTKWIPLLGLSMALAIIIIDGTVMNVSIKYIIKDLEINLEAIQTIMTTYTLIVAALTITGGRLGDIFGYKKMFILGAILFGIGSLIASFSPNGATLMFGWSVLEGIGAAFMTPATTSLIISTYSGKDRSLAFAIWGATAGASAALGPILGGFLTTNYSWRWAFRINLVVVSMLLASALFIKEYKNLVKDKFIDFVGILLSSSGLAFITYAIIKSSDWGWFKAKRDVGLLNDKSLPFSISPVIVMIIVGAILVSGFVLWEKRIKSQKRLPLVNFTIFQDKAFFSGVVTNAVITLGQAGIIFSIPIFYQTILNLDALQTGIGLLPLSLTVLISAPISMKLANKFTPKRIIQAGILFSMIGGLFLYKTISINSTRVDFIPSLIIFAFGFGLIAAQVTNLAMSNIKGGQAGEASGINSTVRQVGQTFGYAIIGAVFIATMQTSLISSIKNMAIPEPAKSKILTVIQDDPSRLQFEGIEQFAKLMPQNPENKDMQIQMQNKMQTGVNHATVDGAKKALIYTQIFYALTFGISTLLPNKKLYKKGGLPIAGH